MHWKCYGFHNLTSSAKVIQSYRNLEKAEWLAGSLRMSDAQKAKPIAKYETKLFPYQDKNQKHGVKAINQNPSPNTYLYTC